MRDTVSSVPCVYASVFHCTTTQTPTLAINKLILEQEALETYQCSAEIYTARKPELDSVLK